MLYPVHWCISLKGGTGCDLQLSLDQAFSAANFGLTGCSVVLQLAPDKAGKLKLSISGVWESRIAELNFKMELCWQCP